MLLEKDLAVCRGKNRKNIRTSIIGCFFFAVFHMFQMAAIYVVVLALVDGSTSSAPAWQALGLLLVSIIGRAIVNRFTQLQQTHAGYFMVVSSALPSATSPRGSRGIL